MLLVAIVAGCAARPAPPEKPVANHAPPSAEPACVGPAVASEPPAPRVEERWEREPAGYVWRAAKWSRCRDGFSLAEGEWEPALPPARDWQPAT